MSFWKDLLNRIASRQRPRKDRRPAPDMAAYYWTNAPPFEHRIRDISTTGLYLLTDERWYPGTLIMLTLQRKDEAADNDLRWISLQSRAIRWGTDGVGLEFILADGRGRGESNPAEQGVDRKTLKKFLNGFKPEEGSAMVMRTAKGTENPS